MDLRCGDFLSEKSCRHKLVVSTSFWSWLLNVSSVLTSLKFTAKFFWHVNALWVCWQFIVVLSFRFWSSCFWNMSFVFVLDTIFCGTIFFIFQDSVWLVKKTWWAFVVPIINFIGLAIVAAADLRCGDFCPKKVVVTNCWFPLPSGLDYWMLLQFWHLWNTRRCFFGLLMRCGHADCSWNFWVLDFGTYVSEICLFCVHPWCDFLWYKIFHYPGQCVAS